MHPSKMRHLPFLGAKVGVELGYHYQWFVMHAIQGVT